MSDIELMETLERIPDGMIRTYRKDEYWAYEATYKGHHIADDGFTNRHCARANALLRMEKEHGVKLTKGRSS